MEADVYNYVEGKATVYKFNTFECEHQNDFEASTLFLYKNYLAVLDFQRFWMQTFIKEIIDSLWWKETTERKENSKISYWIQECVLLPSEINLGYK